MSVYRVAIIWTANGLMLLGFYMLLVAKLSGQEAIAGALTSALAATALTVSVGAAYGSCTPRLAWLPLLGRVPIRVLADCGIVGLALGRRLLGRSVSGRFRVVSFDPGGDEPTSAARRALVTAGVSIAPNTFVVAIDRERQLLLVHQLVPSPEPPGKGDREWPL